MKKSALVIGGGIAGLAAARELARRKVSVTVLEARDRFGGRIRTLQPGTAPIELGAEFIHGESQPLLAAIREAGLDTQRASDKRRLFEHGQFQNFSIWGPAGEIFQRVDPREPDATFDDFLARQTDIGDRTRVLTRHFVEDFNAAYASRISAQALLRAEQAAEQMNGSRQLRVTRGYSALVEFLVDQIQANGGVLVTTATARQIAWRDGRVDLTIERPGRVENLRADAAIITLPVGILKTDEVKFQPSLPDKLAAARGLEFGNVIRIVFQFDALFWDDFGFVHAVNEPILTWWNDPRGPVLTGWAGGPHADALLGHSGPQLEEIGLQILGRIFSTSKDLLRRRLVTAHYWNWSADPHTRGAYSYIPVNGLGLPQLLAAPVANTLFFAGEATVADAQMGTVFGAYESGLRAAREVLGAG